MTPTAQGSNPTLERLEDQIGWYDRKSGSNQRWYKGLKIVTILAGVFVPVASLIGMPLAAAALGIVIVACEGLQQLYQFQMNWIAYRSTSEALKHEKFLFLGEAGSYAEAEKPMRLLAERVEGLVSQEHAKWVSSQEQKVKVAEKKPSDN
jgi:hypothetical protein